MQAQHAARVPGGRAELHDRDARGVRREHRVGVGDDLVELSEDPGFDVFILDHRLDHQLTVGEIGQGSGEPQIVGCAVTFALSDFAGADSALQRGGDTVSAGGDQGLGGLEYDHVYTGPSAYLGNASAHLPGTDDADSFDG